MPAPRLDVLPVRAGSAAANMATDFLLLQRYPDADAARFRHYGWHRPACTFGFSQKLAWVRAQLAEVEDLELCRRPTGGGLVDHRADWTYALVVPRGHALYEARAVESYRRVHEALAAALRAGGTAATLKDHCEPADQSGPDGPGCGLAGVCFQRAELHDVVDPATGAKLAGAAQKRNKRGLLFQGSIARPPLSGLDWEAFAAAFTTNLASTLAADPTETPWPEFADEEVEGLTENYAAPEWLALR